MDRTAVWRPQIASVILALSTVLFVASGAWTQDGEAMKILKTMSDYVVSQKSFSAKYDTDIEVITPAIQKIQFASSGEVLVDRPGRIRVARKGGYSDIELVFDGKTV